MRHLLFTLMMTMALVCSAQSADKLYQEGKKLYDAERYTQAVPKLRAAAQKGHQKAQYRLGKCYDKGHGVTEDDRQAVAWYAKAAAQGHAKSQYELGKCYKNGEGVAKNMKKAIELFTKAANNGNGDAQLALGKCYLKGNGVPVDKAKARAWCKKAVKNDKDGKEIMQKLRKDANEGDADAKAILQLIK